MQMRNGTNHNSAYSCYIAANTEGAGNTISNITYNPRGAGGAGGSYFSCTLSVNVATGVGQSFGGGVGNTSIVATDTNSLGQPQYSGGRLFNCVVSGNTADNGAGVGNAAFASNCIIRDNSGRDGSVGSSILIDCIVTGGSHSRAAAVAFGPGYALRTTIISNKVIGAGATGGGVEIYTLTNCLVAYNSSSASAGGVRNGTLYSCTIVANSGSTAGGVSGGALVNCISWDNIGPADIGFVASYSAGAGYPPVSGNITNDPFFVDSAAGNYRLTETSSCHNAGINESWMTNAVDLDGLPRIVDSTVDMGAYEEQTIPPPGGTVFIFQ